MDERLVIKIIDLLDMFIIDDFGKYLGMFIINGSFFNIIFRYIVDIVNVGF